uniref:STAS domain-containing protein n=1 Tax=Macrostomum lignano TaxID=282301 RepID=A0A1I8FI31_9PLAT
LRTALSSALVAAAQSSEGRVRHVCADLSLATGIDFAVVEALKTVRERLRLLSARLFVVARQPRCAKSWNRPACLCSNPCRLRESGLSASAGALRGDAADHVTAGASGSNSITYSLAD